MRMAEKLPGSSDASQPKVDGSRPSRPQAPRASIYPSVVQYDILSATVTRTTLPAFCRVLPPPIRTCVTLRPRLPQRDSFCRLFPAKRALRVEPLRKTYRLYILLEEGQPPILLVQSNSRKPLKPDNRLGFPPHQARLDRLLLRFRDLCTAYLSNHLSGKPRLPNRLRPVVRQFPTSARQWNLPGSLAFCSAGESTQHTFS